MLFLFIQSGSIFKSFQILILSALKFLLAPPLSFKLGFNFLQTVITTTIGGVLGVLFFFFLSELIIRLFKKIWPSIKLFFVNKKNRTIPYSIKPVKATIKKKFSFKNKFIVKTRLKYGLWGIAILTPILLSIPLGTFLANRYYKNKKSVIFSLAISVVCWSIIMSSFYAFIKIKPF
ncbi:MAG TPA: hypothetical protein PKZ21_00270 [Bacteroidales bacterium]|nr:hypothetical protein [Bacteroidales bacterium]